MIELIDTNAAGIAAEFVDARTRAGSPAMGMVMTLVIVVDEEHAPDAMQAARQASHEHPARVLGVILGDGRGAPQINAQVGTGDGWAGETALIRLKGEVVKHPESVVLPAAAARLPGRDLVAVRRSRRTRRRTPSAGSRSAGSPTPRPSTAARAGPSTPSARRTRPATPTWPGPGSPRGGRCSPPPSTSTRSR